MTTRVEQVARDIVEELAGYDNDYVPPVTAAEAAYRRGLADAVAALMALASKENDAGFASSAMVVVGGILIIQRLADEEVVP